MFENFYPKNYFRSFYSIDFRKFYKKGFNALIIDLDNTLVIHGSDVLPEKVTDKLKTLRKIGFKICIFSNRDCSEGLKHMVKGINFIYNARKPKSACFYKALSLMKAKKEKTLVIGDQILTDILGANRIGLENVLVEPVGKYEPFKIKIKRILEVPFRRVRKKKFD